MKIQLSVLLWTIICFLLTMLILNKLLFKPYLTMIRQRRTRLREARATHEANQAEYLAALQKAEEEALVVKDAFAEESRQAMEAAQNESHEKLMQAQKDQDAEIEAYKETLQAERKALMESITAGLEQVALATAERLTQ